ncbi:MAG: lipoyl synthase [Candidatus Thiodiazotropha sp.]
MSNNKDLLPPSRNQPESHQRGNSKLSRIPVKVESSQFPLRKPKWIRAKAPLGKEVSRIRRILRDKGLSSVCEEAACPNLGECFQQGTATFMIMGDICTRRCPFCDVAHGKPQPLDPQEPLQLADAIASMSLKYVVITSVDRDDLRDGGGNHFAQCVAAIRERMPKTSVELLVPDFRGRVEQALSPLMKYPPDIFNHNLETVPRLYRQARPGADYQGSLDLLKHFKQQQPEVPTKSGLMLGLGEQPDEILAVMQDLRDHQCEMLTLGQYLQPSQDHLPVDRFITPAEFDDLAKQAKAMGFTSVASGPMVRSSYHADLQANPLLEA